MPVSMYMTLISGQVDTFVMSASHLLAVKFRADIIVMHHGFRVSHHFNLWQKRLLVWQSHVVSFFFAIRPCGQLTSEVLHLVSLLPTHIS